MPRFAKCAYEELSADFISRKKRYRSTSRYGGAGARYGGRRMLIMSSRPAVTQRPRSSHGTLLRSPLQRRSLALEEVHKAPVAQSCERNRSHLRSWPSRKRCGFREVDRRHGLGSDGVLRIFRCGRRLGVFATSGRALTDETVGSARSLALSAQCESPLKLWLTKTLSAGRRPLVTSNG